jgi:hypothetical protein
MENFKGRTYLIKLGINGMIILKCISEEWCGDMFAG